MKAILFLSYWYFSTERWTFNENNYQRK